MNYKIISDKDFVVKISSGEEHFSLSIPGENQSGDQGEFLWKLEKNAIVPLEIDVNKSKILFMKLLTGEKAHIYEKYLAKK